MRGPGALQILTDLYSGEGYVVDTEADDSDALARLRTVIQGDGDCAVTVSREALRRPELCRRHLDRVAASAAGLRRLRRSVTVGLISVRLGGAGIVAVSGWEGWRAFLQGQAPWVLGWALFSIPCFFVRHWIRWAAAGYFRRKMKRLAG